MAELPETKAGEKQYLTLSQAALGILRDLPRNGPHVFCWPNGRPLTVDYTTHALHRATERGGTPDLRQHDLRHTFAIRRLRGGANLVAVSGLLPHASTRISERYLHVTRADLRAAVEAGQPLGIQGSPPSDVEALLNDLGRRERAKNTDRGSDLVRMDARAGYEPSVATREHRKWALEGKIVLGG